jgi:hypothetical protein
METIINDFTTPLMLSLLSAYVLFMNNELIDFMMFGIPWSIFLGINSYICCATICWHLGYFHIICYYLALIMKRYHKIIVKNRKLNRANKSIRKLLNRMNNIVVLIHDFNHDFWKKYSAIMFLIYNSFICTLLYETFFVDSNIIVKLLFGYILLVDIVIFSCYMISATIVFQQAEASYKVLTQDYLKIRMPIISKLKVCFHLS